VTLAGAGAGDRLAERIGAEVLVVDPVTAAERLAVRWPRWLTGAGSDD